MNKPGTCNRVLGFRLFGVDPFRSLYSRPRHLARNGAAVRNRLLLRAGILVAKSGDSDSQSGRRLVYCLRRQVGGRSTPKVQAPSPAFRKSSELYNFHRAAHGQCRRVVVVEGFFDCMKVHQAGYPHVVALMGCSLSNQQADLLARHFVEAVLLLDGDQAGQHAMSKIAASLSGTMKVHCGHVPSGGQPDELSPDELRNAIEDAI